MMNVRQFIKNIDQQLATMSESDLRAFVHDLARKIPSDQRESVLKKLFELQNNQINNVDVNDELSQLAQEFLIQIEQIKTGQRYLESVMSDYDYDYGFDFDDWYEDDDENIYSDPTGIVDSIREIFDFIFHCMDEEAYDIAYSLSNELATLEISLEGDRENDKISVHELYDEWSERLDYKQYVICHAYLLYLQTDRQKRAKVLYQWFLQSDYVDYGLQNVLMYTNHTEDLQVFLPVWIDYLGNLDTQIASELIVEAFSILNNDETQLAFAKKFVKYHPELYLQYLETHLVDSLTSTDSMQQLYEIGVQAIQQIQPIHKIRSQIAEKIRTLAEKMNAQERIDQCHWWIFESDSTIAHFLELMTTIQVQSKAKFIHQTQQLLQNIHLTDDDYTLHYKKSKALIQNSMSQSRLFTLQYLCGNDNLLLENELTPVHDIFLIMYSSKKKVSSEGEFVLRRALRKVDELRGVDSKNVQSFASLLLKYRDSFDKNKKVLAANFSTVEHLVSRFVQETIEEKNRNNYQLCAAYVALVAEVRVNLRKSVDKQALLRDYYLEYKRYPTFVRELEKYGLKR